MLSKILNVLRDPSKLISVPLAIIAERRREEERRAWLLLDEKNSERNYSFFLESEKVAVDGDLPYSLDKVEDELAESGYKPEDYIVDIERFREYFAENEEANLFYSSAGERISTEKTLEHFVSLSFTELNDRSRVIDIANAKCPFPSIIHEKYGCQVWSSDLILPSGVHRNGWLTEVGGDACELPVEDNYFDLAVMHCALEMFEGDSDRNIILRAERFLKPGGKLVIAPLYLSEKYHIFRDPKTTRGDLPPVDEGAELIYRNNFHNLAFARFYSVAALMDRLVNGGTKMKFTVYRVRNLKDVHPGCYLHWIGVFEKMGEGVG